MKLKKLKNELWLPLSNGEGYLVSSFGRISDKSQSFALKQKVQNNGYLSVTLFIDGRRNSYLVHRLVAKTFLVNQDTSKNHVCHWDNDKTNNCVSNLRWATPSENMFDKTRHGTHSKWQSSKKFCPRGAILELPNLTQASVNVGHRVCWSCSLMNSKIFTDNKRKGIQYSVFEKQQIHDFFLEEIMSGKRQYETRTQVQNSHR